MSFSFTEKVGPLPLWSYAAIAGGLYYYRSRTASAASAATAASGTGTVDLSGGSGVGGTPAGWIDTSASGLASSQNAPTIATLDDWARAAETYLIGRNYDPALVDTAVRNYVSGGQLQANQWTIIGQAIQGIGPTPTALPSVQGPPTQAPVVTTKPTATPTGSGSTTKPKSPPAKVVTKAPAPKVKAPIKYTVRKGDTLSSIASHYGTTWQAIYNANHNILKNPNIIYPNQILVIP